MKKSLKLKQKIVDKYWENLLMGKKNFWLIFNRKNQEIDIIENRKLEKSKKPILE